MDRPIDNIKPTETPLGRYCIKPSATSTVQLVSLAQLNQWSQEAPQKSIEALLVRNHVAIRNEVWMDCAANTLPEHPPYPVHVGFGVCPAAISREGIALYKEHYAIILQEWPYKVIGVLNLRSDTVTLRAASNMYPGEEIIHRVLSPWAFSYLGGKIESRTATFDRGAFGDDSAIEWAEILGLDLDSFLTMEQVLAYLWLDSQLPTTVIPPGQITQCNKVRDLEALLVAQSPTHAWVGTFRALDSGLYLDAQQVIGKKIIPLAITPRDYARLLSIIETPKKASHSVTLNAEKPVQIADWNFVDRASVDTFEEYVDRCADKILSAAIEMGASDIHIEPKDQRVQIRFRINGSLAQQPPITRGMWDTLCQRFKTIAAMRPESVGDFQDGAGDFKAEGVRHDFRFSVVPSTFGDAMVIRYLNSRILKLSELNLHRDNLALLNWFLSLETGLMLTSGPTGSGKTTTQYACLDELATPDSKIITIEEPVEKHFEQAVQININQKAGKTWEEGLRAMLRHDPDIIMIGEIRDEVSAKIAIESAMTGHLTFGTVHADSPGGIVERMFRAWNIPPITIANALKLALYQRLIPCLCPQCRHEREPRSAELRYFPEVPVAQSKIAERRGCAACRYTGVSGRISVIEMMPVDDKMAGFLAENCSADKLRKANRNMGYLSALEQATYLLLTGVIDLRTALGFVDKPFNG
jgi:type II secretory ATPase GspE/PulE/Tfp pilus assembly ATPase PilB-like protein